MTPFVLVVHPSVPARNMKEFITIAKSKPNAFTMGSGGVGHLVGELFQTMTGTKFLHVPFQGTGPAGIALMGRIARGQITKPVSGEAGRRV